MAKKFEVKVQDKQVTPLGQRPTLERYVSQFGDDILKYQKFFNGMEALEFWKYLFDPEGRTEHQFPVKNTVEWPYANRLIYLARKFIKLSDHDRDFIQMARNQKVFWRGDDIKHFDLIVEETLDFRSLKPDEKERYKKRIWDMAMTLRKRHGQTA
jgi:hypothetical protein